MSKILRGVKGLFFRESEKEQEESTDAIDSQPKAEPESFEAQWTQEDLAEGEVNEKFLNILLKNLNEANLPGYDYLEYRKALLSLAEMEMSEEQRYKSAFVMAQTMNANLEELKSSVGHYLEVLEREAKEFGRSFENRRTQTLDATKVRIEDLQKSIAAKKAEIKRIQKELNSEEAALQKELESQSHEEDRLTSVKNDFGKSLQHIGKQIKEDQEKILLYLK